MKNRVYSLKRLLLQNVVGIMAVVFCMFLLMMAAEYWMLKNMNATVEKNSMLTMYYQTTEAVSQTLEEYFYFKKSETGADCLKKAEQLLQEAEVIKQEISHPRFTDLYYLTESYKEQIESLLKKNSDALRGDYLLCTQTETYIQDDRNALNSILSEIISDTYRTQYRSWKQQFLFLMIVFSICSIYIFMVSSDLIKKVSAPIISLAEQARQFADGMIHTEQKENDKLYVRENEVLRDSFYEMEEIIQKQMTQLREKILLERDMHNLELQNINMKMSLTETRMQLIQSMLNPHFLFNCLGTLSAMAYFEKAPKTREISLKIADYLRGFLEVIGKEITVKEELVHTEKYIQIQQVRFAGQIQFEIQAEESSLECMIPAMVLQPLVENSIAHGLKDREDGGKICIYTRVQDDKLEIIVEDDGEGIEPEMLETLSKELEQPFCPGEGSIGLHGVAARIKMRYQEQKSIEIFSEKGHFTRVRICISKELPEEPIF